MTECLKSELLIAYGEFIYMLERSNDWQTKVDIRAKMNAVEVLLDMPITPFLQYEN